MDQGPIKIEKLAGPDGDGSCAYCNENGLFIGPGIALVTRGLEDLDGTSGFRPQPKAEIDRVLTQAYGTSFDSTPLSGGFAAVAKALNAGDMTRAIIASLHLRLPRVPADGANRLAKYIPDEPRDWRGRWTTEDDAGGSPTKSPSPHENPAEHSDQQIVSDPVLHELCMKRCYMLLEAPKIRRDSNLNQFAFYKCQAECDELYG